MTGYVAVSVISEGEYRAPLDELSVIMRQVEDNSRLYKFTGIYGQSVCVIACRVEAVTVWTPDSLESFDRSRREEVLK